MEDGPSSKNTDPKDLLEWLGLRNAPNWKVARPLGKAFGVLLTLLFVLALAAAVVTLAKSFFTTPENPFASLGATALIVALLGAPFLIWNTVIRHKALGFQKEGHLTDRLSKAVEQLGVEKSVKAADMDGNPTETTQPNIEVRIGAILLLERIAQDSTDYDKGRDHVRVMEILCAYLRENAPASGAKISLREQYEIETADGDGVQGLTDLQFAERHKITPADFDKAIGIDRLKLWAQSLAAPRADIALALRAIGRRGDAQRGVEARWGKDAAADAIWVFDLPCPALPDRADDSPRPVADLDAYQQELAEWKKLIGSYRGYRLDLRATNLQRADLSDLTLSGALLNGVRMEGAFLMQARMAGANLWQTRMDGAHLFQARMEGANLGLTQMKGADLRDVRMQGANLTKPQMEGAQLSSARMEGVDLGAARMVGANLRYAYLQGANLGAARLQEADLSWARLEGANLWAARLEGALLRDARMDANTQLRIAVLRNQDWSTVPISQGQIDGTFGDGSVILPDGLTRPAHWPQGKLDDKDFNAEWRKWQSDPKAYAPPAP